MTYNNNGNSSLVYNNFKQMPLIPYKIFEKLVNDTNDSAEDLWKALRYNSSDALSKPNLTYVEKMNMLWTPDDVNSSQENLFNVFLKPLVASALDDSSQQIQLRINRYVTKPTNNVESTIAYQFDVITHEKCSMIYSGKYLIERTDFIESCLLDCLNGADIGSSSSFLSFNSQMMNSVVKSTLNISNNKSLYGRTFYMALIFVDAGIGGTCGG